MEDDEKTKPRLEIAQVLFIDIVGYSKLLTDEQSEALQELNQIVRDTEAVREAEAAGQLIILPTGDGMALVFTGSVEGPAECALEVGQALRAQGLANLQGALDRLFHGPGENQRHAIARGQNRKRSCTLGLARRFGAAHNLVQLLKRF